MDAPVGYYAAAEGPAEPPPVPAALEAPEMASALLAATDADESPELAAEAISSVLRRVEQLAAENEALRGELAEERASRLGLLEANRELEWRVRTGTAASVPAGSAQEEWEATEARLALLLAENNELESRERQTAEELRRERATTSQLMASHAEALATAQQAANAAEQADAKASEEAAAARDAADAAREAQALAAASDAALSNLRNELAAARAESQAAHREVAARRHEIERLHAQLAGRQAEEEARRSAERHAHGELERRLTEAHAEVQRGENLLAECRGQADGHATAAERMREAAEAAEAAAERQAQLAAESARAAKLARE